MEKRDEEFRKDLEYMLRLLKRVECLEKKTTEQLDEIDKLREENRRLLYEYPTSLLKRDEPLPYKWRYDGKRTFQFCPKCEMMISNWQSYCHACGQKIGQGNPLPEMEIKNEQSNLDGERREG